jgi:hypothetical protein
LQFQTVFEGVRFLGSYIIAEPPHSKRVFFEAIGDARHSATRLLRNYLGSQVETQKFPAVEK